MPNLTEKDLNKLNNKIKESSQFLQKYFNYLLVIRNRSAGTLRTYVYRLLDFFKYMVCVREYGDEEQINNLSDEELLTLIKNKVDKSFVETIEEFDILNFLYYIQRKGTKVSTRNNYLSAIKSFFKYCSKKYGIKDVAVDIESAKLEEKQPIFLTLDECKSVIEYARNKSSKRDYCILILFLNCGMRISELISINKSDITGTTIKIMGKGSKERTVYLNEACLRAIEDCLKETLNYTRIVDREALFVSMKTGKRLSVRRIEQIISNMMAECGLSDKGYSPHKLRHTAATIMYQNGTDIRALKDILGHTELSTTQIYTHINDEKLQEAINNNPIGKL